MVTGMEKPYVVGMDIGGTNTVFGIVDSRGNVLATDSVKTQSFSKIEDYVEAVSSKLRPLIESFGGVEKIKGMDIKCWVHGHTHSTHDYMIGNTRVLCNPRGYPREYGLPEIYLPKYFTL
jgi:predicted NBD/HSP70 family sugar kinase